MRYRHEKRVKDKKAQKGKRGCKKRGMGLRENRVITPNRIAAKFCILRFSIMFTIQHPKTCRQNTLA